MPHGRKKKQRTLVYDGTSSSNHSRTRSSPPDSCHRDGVWEEGSVPNTPGGTASPGPQAKPSPPRSSSGSIHGGPGPFEPKSGIEMFFEKWGKPLMIAGITVGGLLVVKAVCSSGASRGTRRAIRGAGAGGVSDFADAL